MTQILSLIHIFIEARPFASVEELAQVRGIGPRKLVVLREWCVV